MTPPAFDPRVPFDRQKARDAGITVTELRGPRYRKLFHDCYVCASVKADVQTLARAALSICAPGSHVSHHTAARLWGGIVPSDPDVHVSVPSGSYRTRRDGVRPHLANAEADVVRHRGLPVSSPSQAFLDLATRLALVDLVVLGDSLVSAGVVTIAELADAARRWVGHGARRARQAADLVRAGVDSPMETRLRLLIVLAGLPEPVVDHHITREDGTVRYRLDLSYPGWRIAVEYDGRQHAESSVQWRKDISRREALDSLRWRLLIVTAEDIYGRPGEVLARLEQMIAEAGVVGVRVRTTAWRRHFPGRRGG